MKLLCGVVPSLFLFESISTSVPEISVSFPEQSSSFVDGKIFSNNSPITSQFVSAYKTCIINVLMHNATETNGKTMRLNSLPVFISFISPAESTSAPLDSHTPFAPINIPVDPNNTSVPSVLFNITSFDPNKFLKNIRFHTNSYIAGFICRNFLNRECNNCPKYFLDVTCTDSHAMILLKDSTGCKTIMYPSKDLIGEVGRCKEIIFNNVVHFVNNPNLVDELNSLINFNMYNYFCHHKNEILKSR